MVTRTVRLDDDAERALARLRKIFTIVRKDFTVYRLRRGHRQLTFEMLA